MDNLEVIARLSIRPGQLEGFEAQAAEILRLTRERDAHTLRCDWFVSEDQTECEVHETFLNEQALIEHKMNTMEATEVLFRDHAFGHRSTIYGHVSPDFVRLVTERVGPPTVFTFVHGLAPRETGPERGAGQLEVIARMKVRPGRLEGFKAQTAEILRLTVEHDRSTLRYDWFVDGSETECEVHELYEAEQGLIEHNQHVVEARDVLFREYASDHRMSVYGEISEHLSDLFAKHAGGVSKFSRIGGLDRAVAAEQGVM